MKMIVTPFVLLLGLLLTAVFTVTALNVAPESQPEENTGLVVTEPTIGCTANETVL